jgi:hypothetical protein
MNTLHFTIDIDDSRDPLRVAELVEAYLGGIAGVTSQDWALNPQPTEASPIKRHAREAALGFFEAEYGAFDEEGNPRELPSVDDDVLDEVVALGFIRGSEAVAGLAGRAGRFMVEVAAILNDEYETTQEQTLAAGEVQPSGPATPGRDAGRVLGDGRSD